MTYTFFDMLNRPGAFAPGRLLFTDYLKYLTAALNI